MRDGPLRTLDGPLKTRDGPLRTFPFPFLDLGDLSVMAFSFPFLKVSFPFPFPFLQTLLSFLSLGACLLREWGRSSEDVGTESSEDAGRSSEDLSLSFS